MAQERARIVETLTVGGDTPPLIYLKCKVCERMHWTFTQFDAQPVSEVAALIEIWRLEQQYVRPQ